MKPEHASRLSALFDAHEERLYRLARRLAPTADDALDLVQETFLKAARAPESIPRGPQGEEAWLVRVLVNLQRDTWRKEKVRQRHDEVLKRSTIDEDDPEGAFVIRTIIWQALDHLPPRRRAVVVMHEIDGLDTRAIAAVLGVSSITVRWHLAQGRRDLARRLARHSGDSHESPQQPLAGRRPAPSRSTAP